MQDKIIEDERKKQRSVAFKLQLKVRMAKDRLRTAIEVAFTQILVYPLGPRSLATTSLLRTPPPPHH